MLIEQGKRLISVMEYAHLLMPMNFPDDESWINRYGIVSELGVDLLMLVATSAGRYRFMPGPEFSPRLYRGQNQFFSTCMPSIFRVTSDVDVHTLVPGLTGWAQVNGRDELPIPEKVKLDVAYLQRQSLWFDIRILWLTFVKVLRRDGVSH